MRYVLADQVGISLPGVVDQRSLTVLAGRYGLAAEDDAAPSARLGGQTGGGAQLLVLSRDLTDELLAEPIDEDLEDATAVTMAEVRHRGRSDAGVWIATSLMCR